MCQPNQVTANGCVSPNGTQVGAAKTLNGNGSATSDATTNTNTPGMYCWRADYSSNSKYLSGQHTNTTTECFTVAKRDTTTATAIHLGSNHSTDVQGTSVALGSSIHDSATVTASGGPAITGTVTFTFFTNGTCNGTGTAAGTASVSSGVAHPSTSQVVQSVGSYSLQATYSGDTNFNGSTGVCEPVSVGKSNLTVTTEIHNDTTHAAIANGSALALNSSVHDSATVSGIIGSVAPTNDVMFTFYRGSVCGAGGEEAGSVALGSVSSGSATAHPSQSKTALTAGQYSFQASIADDANYTGATSACEPFSVNKAPSGVITELHNGLGSDAGGVNVLNVGGNAASNTVHDKASVTGQVGAIALTGNVTFKFYTTQTACTADSTAAGGTDKGTVALVGGVAHPSQDASALSGGSYAFRARYNGDANYDGSVAAANRSS